MSLIDLKPEHLLLIQKVLAEAKDVRVFGSRVLGKAKEFSDVDICVLDHPAPGYEKLSEWKQKFDESDLPIVVDLSLYEDLADVIRTAVDWDGVRI